jgi:serine/threonine protein phosphatase PrpC
MNDIHIHCQGESHKASDKPCQDYSYSYSSDELSIAIVCDGHGGERYFRSQWGSQFATEVIESVVKEFVRTTSKSLFRGEPFTAEGVVTGTEKKLSYIDKEMRQMFSSIITRWEERIKEHAGETPVTEWEEENVPKKYIDEFLEGKSLEKQYGCTLMAYVQTKTYWFAFHLGDGKCIAFYDDDNVWNEPIPWDDRCFLNKTTSICDSDAINEFRYCY